MSDRLEQNKKNARAFYDMMFNQCRPREAVEKYVGDVYIQHNPDVAVAGARPDRVRRFHCKSWRAWEDSNSRPSA